ncbi:hypothetical protein OFB65_27235, partial [Escherichia coli]|nr:hypothetical protein [Escherichia coli]
RTWYSVTSTTKNIVKTGNHLVFPFFIKKPELYDLPAATTPTEDIPTFGVLSRGSVGREPASWGSSEETKVSFMA